MQALRLKQSMPDYRRIVTLSLQERVCRGERARKNSKNQGRVPRAMHSLAPPLPMSPDRARILASTVASPLPTKAKTARQEVLFNEVNSQPAALQLLGYGPCRVGAGEGIEYHVAFVGEEPHKELRQGRGKTRRMNLDASFLAALGVKIVFYKTQPPGANEAAPTSLHSFTRA